MMMATPSPPYRRATCHQVPRLRPEIDAAPTLTETPAAAGGSAKSNIRGLPPRVTLPWAGRGRRSRSSPLAVQGWRTWPNDIGADLPLRRVAHEVERLMRRAAPGRSGRAGHQPARRRFERVQHRSCFAWLWQHGHGKMCPYPTLQKEDDSFRRGKRDLTLRPCDHLFVMTFVAPGPRNLPRDNALYRRPVAGNNHAPVERKPPGHPSGRNHCRMAGGTDHEWNGVRTCWRSACWPRRRLHRRLAIAALGDSSGRRDRIVDRKRCRGRHCAYSSRSARERGVGWSLGSQARVGRALVSPRPTCIKRQLSRQLTCGRLWVALTMAATRVCCPNETSTTVCRPIGDSGPNWETTAAHQRLGVAGHSAATHETTSGARFKKSVSLSQLRTKVLARSAASGSSPSVKRSSISLSSFGRGRLFSLSRKISTSSPLRSTVPSARRSSGLKMILGVMSCPCLSQATDRVPGTYKSTSKEQTKQGLVPNAGSGRPEPKMRLAAGGI
jgi:hypothetical protein